MDVLTSMEMFMRVAEAKNFSVVAREKDICQSTVSKHITALEKRLHTTLFNRSTRQLQLTESGDQYYYHCGQILSQLAEAEMSVGLGQSSSVGTLRVSSTATFGRLFILPFLWDFMDEHPNIKVDMILEDRYVDLVKEGIDMAVRVGPLSDSGMIAKNLGVSERVIVASQCYLDSHGEPESLIELKNHDCLLYSLQPSPHEWEFKNSNRIESVRVDGRFSSTNPESIGEAAIAGLGIAVVMLWSVRDHIESGRLKIILKDYKPTPFKVNAVYPGRQFVPHKVKKLIEHLQENYKKHYPLLSKL